VKQFFQVIWCSKAMFAEQALKPQHPTATTGEIFRGQDAGSRAVSQLLLTAVATWTLDQS